MTSEGSTAIWAGLGVVMFLFLAVVSLAIYLFISYCYKRISEKCGVNPGALVWIPIARLVPLLQVAKMPIWFIVLFLIPFVNLVIFFMMWAKICVARGKSGWLAVLFIVPIANLVLIPYLAFSD